MADKRKAEGLGTAECTTEKPKNRHKIPEDEYVRAQDYVENKWWTQTRFDDWESSYWKNYWRVSPPPEQPFWEAPEEVVSGTVEKPTEEEVGVPVLYEYYDEVGPLDSDTFEKWTEDVECQVDDDGVYQLYPDYEYADSKRRRLDTATSRTGETSSNSHEV
jgi:hypothetical protein